MGEMRKEIDCRLKVLEDRTINLKRDLEEKMKKDCDEMSFKIGKVMKKVKSMGEKANVPESVEVEKWGEEVKSLVKWK